METYERLTVEVIRERFWDPVTKKGNLSDGFPNRILNARTIMNGTHQ